MVGSKMEKAVRCAVIAPTESREIWLQSTFSIFNSKPETINIAITANPAWREPLKKRAILSDSLTYLTALNKVKRIDENEAAQNCLRRLEKLNKQKARGKKTNRMGIIGKSDSDIETMNKKKQQRGENRW
jgi:hypothetical protein